MFNKGINPFGVKPSSYTEIVNDIDNRVVNFFRVLQSREAAAELIYRIERTPFARAEPQIPLFR